MAIPCKACSRILDLNKMQKELDDYKNKKEKNEPIDETKYNYHHIYDEENNVVIFHCDCGRPILHDVVFIFWGDDPNIEEKFEEYIRKVEKNRKKEYDEFSKEYHWK